MLFVLAGIFLYFLPSIIAHNKRDFAAILLLNLFLGWTVIGWIVALVWACAAEVKPHVIMLAAGAVPARFCCRCGAITAPGGRFCGVCGTPL
jgi:Superinfection immunity protein